VNAEGETGSERVNGKETSLQGWTRMGPLFAKAICAPAKGLLMTMEIVGIDAR